MRRLPYCAFILALLLATCTRAAPSATGAAPAALGGCDILPSNNIWNTPIASLPVDAQSDEYIASINLDAQTLHPDFGSSKYGYYGIPYNIVPQGQAKVAVDFDYADESDSGPYPIPPSPLIEGGSDHHILVVEQGTCKLYETWDSSSNGDGTWHAGSGAVFDLGSNALRTDTWTSADAAGLPILPGLARYDEVAAGAINHALRFTVDCSANFYIWPARHKAVPDSCPSTPPNGTQPPPLGLRLRLKASVDISGYSAPTRVILTALKKYGMFVADNGSSWYISGEPNEGWDDDTLVEEFRQIAGSDFEAVDESALQVSADSGQAKAAVTDSKSVVPGGADQGQAVQYSILLGGDGSTITLSDPLPSGLNIVGSPSISGSSVQPTYNSGTRTISWSAAPANLSSVTILYTATVSISATQTIVNTATVTRGDGQSQLTAQLIANPQRSFLPLTRR